MQEELSEYKDQFETLENYFKDSIKMIDRERDNLRVFLLKGENEVNVLLDNLKIKVNETENQMAGQSNLKLKELDDRIAEILEKVDSFVEQTSVFDKAYHLKDQLDKHIKEYENKFKKVKSKESYLENIHEKVSFLEEKERKVAEIYKNVETKEKDITAIRNTLNEVIELNTNVTEQIEVLNISKKEVERFLKDISNYQDEIKGLKGSFEELATLKKKLIVCLI